MIRECWNAILAIILTFIISNASGQSKDFDLVVNFIPGDYSIAQTLQVIEDNNNIFFTYNSSPLNNIDKFKFRNKQYVLNDILNYILRSYEFEASYLNSDRVGIRIRNKNTINLHGYIVDKESSEVLSGAVIQDLNTGASVFSNGDGFFSINLLPGNQNVLIKYLGYDSLLIQKDIYQNESISLPLTFSNTTPTIFITGDHSDGNEVSTPGYRINHSSVNSFGSAVGVDDIVNRLRYNPGVQSGNEGVGGLFVRGGSVDQNLILYDGVPLYEISHTAGISSIFINEGINNIELIKSGFPARYTGRLSSVVNVKMKEGNPINTESKVLFGNYGPGFNINGPIGNSKITYNISGRTSWIHLYLNALISDVIDYDDINVRFTDLNAKFTYNIDSKNKLNFTSYYGTDNLGLTNEDQSTIGAGSFTVTEKNNFKWGSKLASLNFSSILSDNLHLGFNAGYIKYKYQSQGSFRFIKFSINDAIIDEVDVVSISEIEDFRLSSTIDYFVSNNYFLKLGTTFSTHRYAPTIRQSVILLDDQDVNQIRDNSEPILANELNLFVENNIKLNNKVTVFAGVNYSYASVRKASYQYFEPRLSFNLNLGKDYFIRPSYSRLHQFVHLLVNPGLGLPSNLWVPSTDKIRPEKSDQINLALTKKFNKNIKLNIDLYSKWTDGLVEYLLADGLYGTIINDDNFIPIFNEDKDWENNITSGKGYSKGIEFLTEANFENWNLWVSYALSKSEKTFEDINDGLSFPYKYDRRHDINLGLESKFGGGKRIGMNWVYGTGTAFTLALEVFPGVDGIELLNPGDRNNFRLPAFHHLDIFYEYENLTSNLPYSIKIGVYNIYNHLNPYYVILYKNEVDNRPILKQVSIFPISPYVIFRTDL